MTAYATRAELAAHIREQAAALVLRVNPGADAAAPAFAAKAAEVADAMARRLCLDNIAAGRPDIAREVRLAWEAR